MKLLFDQGVPIPLRKLLAEHSIETAFERGWDRLSNGDLLAQAESGGFDGFVTTDKNLKYQQDLSSRSIHIFVLSTPSWPKIRERLEIIERALRSHSTAGYTEVELE